MKPFVPYSLFTLLALMVTGMGTCFAQQGVRRNIQLNSGWRTVANDTSQNAFNGFQVPGFNDRQWMKVSVPHNWDQYEGYRRLRHGNRHGYAWYRKTFTAPKLLPSKHCFLWFEGVGSYATVWLNGHKVGHHDGGRTSFTFDVTGIIKPNGANVLAVRAGHPAMIQDLPWVCGGCSEDRGFSEGSQPMGIFRPVHLVITNAVRIEPFGVHLWNNDSISAGAARLHLETEVKNYGAKPLPLTVLNQLLAADGAVVATMQNQVTLPSGDTRHIMQQTPVLIHPRLWSPEDPYLYTMVTTITNGATVTDRVTTPYGIRWIHWWEDSSKNIHRFYLNGKPVFINGIAEYEHMMGQSHAFSSEQVRARAMQVQALGFNAFRDAHQPHNLRYQQYWDSLGILWWPQFSAHVWYDTPAFRASFKTLITEWIKERRNSPSVILWGLQNESKLPEDFARECTQLIRDLDPTASSQRKITTCNGGAGTDWDVPQNWTGTYGGDPATYAEDIRRQALIGEYGAWRTLDLHTEGGFRQNGALSEDRMTQLMETKVRLAESVRDKSYGQFHWIFSSHENPGRVQSGEGMRELDRVGPVNYKGLLTPWGEPLDAYYMFRANYAPPAREPMVYIVSHTWPDRWMTAGKKDSIIIYSNCDSVELFNDGGSLSLGTKTRHGTGTHFQWDGVNIQYNVLYAEGKINGKTVARDRIILQHLPPPPSSNKMPEAALAITKPAPGYRYLYRVNCGGPQYKDKNGNTWSADVHKTGNDTWGSLSWTDAFTGLPSFYASQRSINTPVSGTADEPLFQRFRYGQNRLRYYFPVPDGDYRVELYFTEPWYGPNAGNDCTGWRVFDVALNGATVLKNLDIWKEAGYAHALRKTLQVHVTGGSLLVSFPSVASGQAVVSAIAIACTRKLRPAPAAPSLLYGLQALQPAAGTWSLQTWLSTGDKPFGDDTVAFSALPPELYGCEWIKTSAKNTASGAQAIATFRVRDDADVYIGASTAMAARPAWLNGFADAKKTVATDRRGGTTLSLWHKRFSAGSAIALGDAAAAYTVFVNPVTGMEPPYDLKPVIKYEAEEALLAGAEVAAAPFAGKTYAAFTQAFGGSITWNIAVGVADAYAFHFRYSNRTGKPVVLNMQLLSADGIVMKQEPLVFPPTTLKWAVADATTGSFINAGNYRVMLTSAGDAGTAIDALEVQ